MAGEEERATGDLVGVADSAERDVPGDLPHGVVVGEKVVLRGGGADMPGLMQLTRIPCGAPSAASWRVMATTAPLLAVWAMRVLVIDPVMPAVEPTSSTLAAPLARRKGQACLHARKTRSSSLRSTKDQSSNEVSSSGEKRVAPALL